MAGEYEPNDLPQVDVDNHILEYINTFICLWRQSGADEDFIVKNIV